MNQVKMLSCEALNNVQIATNTIIVGCEMLFVTVNTIEGRQMGAHRVRHYICFSVYNLGSRWMLKKNTSRPLRFIRFVL